VILALKSEFLAEALKSTHEVNIPFADPENLFPDILKFMYSNTLVVKASQV
jgi:hypothetical protein